LPNNNWRTPKWFYDSLNIIFKFDLDPCTTKDNPLNTPHFFTEEDDGLKQSWFGNVFVNPPYGYNELPNGKRGGEYLLEKWVRKAWNEIVFNDKVKNIVLLVPAAVSTKWFHQYVWNDATNMTYQSVKDGYLTDLAFPDKRIQYLDETGKKKQSPRFDSMIITYSKIDQ
jgi:phage N-6-adenine-methyltransferase